MLCKNRLLNALPVQELNRLECFLSPATLRPRQIMHGVGQSTNQVHFIEEGLVSVLADTGAERLIEVWLIGCEGLVGLPAVLGGFRPPFRRIALMHAHALHIGADDLKRAMQDSLPLTRLLLRYVQSNLIHASQAAACNTQHTVKERIVRWLLLAHDRMPGDQIPLTHALLARLLGVRRATVTGCLGMLEEDGAIRQRRGTIMVIDRERLEHNACNCYRIIAAAYENCRRL